MHNVFHVGLLHLYLPGGTQKGPLDLIVAGKNQEYKIERIVTHKKTRIKILYQVIWRGYDVMENNMVGGSRFC